MKKYITTQELRSVHTRAGISAKQLILNLGSANLSNSSEKPNEEIT